MSTDKTVHRQTDVVKTALKVYLLIEQLLKTCVVKVFAIIKLAFFCYYLFQ